MRLGARNLLAYALLGAIVATGCEHGGPAEYPDLPRAVAPPRAAKDVRTVRTVLTLGQREQGSPDEVVVERRRRCLVEWLERLGELRLVQGEPEQVRLRRGSQSWERIPVGSGVAGEAQGLPGQGLLRAWLPDARVEAGEAWTRTTELQLAGQSLAVTHVTRVESAEGGRLRVTTHARGERSWGSTGVQLTIEGGGQALLLDGARQWPERIDVSYRLRVEGGPGADAESRVRFELTLDEEPRS
jgi:hypothetical protein